MKKLCSLLVTFAASLVLFGSVTSAHATMIEYTQTGNTLNFTIFNDTLLTAISSFDVSFGLTTDGLNFTNVDAFTDVSDGTAPTGWVSYALPASAIDNPWLYSSNVDTGGTPIAFGGNLSGFSTDVTLSPTAPTTSLDKLWFNIYDDNFNTIDHGYATLHDNGVNNPVPEPSTMLLLGAGLGGLALYRRKRT